MTGLFERLLPRSQDVALVIDDQDPVRAVHREMLGMARGAPIVVPPLAVRSVVTGVRERKDHRGQH
jgi:hypothetical protein